MVQQFLALLGELFTTTERIAKRIKAKGKEFSTVKEREYRSKEARMKHGNPRIPPKGEKPAP